LTIALVIVVLSVAYIKVIPPPSTHNSSNSAATAYSPIYQGLQLAMTLQANKTVFQLGEKIDINFTLTNVSNQTVNLSLVDVPDNVFNFLVFPHNGDGNSLYEWTHGAFGRVNETINLAPNERYTGSFTWKQNGNLDMPSQVPSRTYDIVGAIWSSTLWSHRYLVTAPLNITITN
jgi:hypothetical protein